ncbi:hypothetical protein RD792_011324 [Penstemon davidsonii]|uniref:THO complex subunit 2 n=1 Tax=Penstemon davidsonii TaxID=160366 RepID=A0ABR0D4A5_9LAMI|nr:hypothetical protein RD792_011324 [Penstemon davidsonii]
MVVKEFFAITVFQIGGICSALLVSRCSLDGESFVDMFVVILQFTYNVEVLVSALFALYTHLLPKDAEAFEHYNAFSAKKLDERVSFIYFLCPWDEQANKIGKINLAATGKDLMDDDKQGDVTVDLFATLDMETMVVSERSSELTNSQTLGLLMGFLAVDDWFHAHQLLERLSPINPVEHIQICNGLFRLIEKIIFPAYNVVCQMQISIAGVSPGSSADPVTTSLSFNKSFISMPKELFEMLASAGPYLYRDTLLLQKTTRVLRAYCLCALELVGNGNGAFSSHTVAIGNKNPRLHLKDARLRIEEALGTCLLPSLQLIPANPAVGQEIWELMSLLPYEVRYRLYGEWEKDDERFPMILAARQTARLDTRRILKRLAKENLKQLGRMVAKLAHANPMTVLRTIVHQIEAYRDMITPVVDAFKYLTQLEYDILEYVVIERLAQGGREKLKEDGLNLSDWLQSLASFWGHLYAPFSLSYFYGLPFIYYVFSEILLLYLILPWISMECFTQFAGCRLSDGEAGLYCWRCCGPDKIGCKKYPSMELRGLFQYLANQLKKGNGNELVLLQELIQQMANVQYTENMTEEQLDAMAGSDTLRYQATSFGITRNNKALIKSTNRLRDSLLPKEEPKLAVPLLLLIAQHRSLVVIKANVAHIKMVSEHFDRCHGTLLQYVDFLCSAVTPTSSYALLIPTLDELVHQYHLDPEVAFLIYRPVMRLFRCQNTSSSFWPLDCNEVMNLAEKESEASDTSSTLVLDLGSSRNPVSWLKLLDTIKTMLPSKAWNSLSADLYATFWGLTLYDLYVPRNRYESEIGKQHAALKALEELSDNSSSAIAKRKKDKERIQESLDRLTTELQKHEEHVESVRRRLAREKDTWLSSCLDTLKINMEFLQRCIFPRCTFSMPDAVYCAHFVNTLHSLGTPFFNTVNHIDVLICKTLQPMICCCTEYEVGRLGRFLFETLKTAYHWKSDESIYERECGNMPGFAVYYRYPNSQRVTYGQFIKVHWKWSQRITRLLIQCLESIEYMEIRNALIMLTKISGVFPVTRKSGINLEKRVAKIRSDEREDLKVLATGVAAALAARKPSWVTDEEFGMGYLEIKPVPAPAPKSLPANSTALQNGAGLSVSPAEQIGGSRTASAGSLHSDSGNLSKESRRSDVDTLKQVDEMSNKQSEDNSKVTTKTTVEPEARPVVKRHAAAGSLGKQAKQDSAKDDGNANIAPSVKGTNSSTRASDHNSESKVEIAIAKSSELKVYNDGSESSDLEYDILEYVVIERLAQGGREKLKEDGLNLSDWLQSLASFWGHLCKKYPSMELRGLFQYLANQLKKGNGNELVLLQELIQQMANVQYTENMTEEQLDAMAGSDTLRYQATSFGITRNNKALIKSTNRLRDSLLPKEEPKLAVPLLLLIAQHRSLVVIKANVAHIKMVSEHFDRCHGTLLQYVDFLCSAVTPTSSYALLIPTLDELVHQYHLDPEVYLVQSLGACPTLFICLSVAFLIYRPVMRLFRCQNTSSSFWPLDCNEVMNLAEKESEASDTSSTLVLDLGSSRNPVSWLKLLDTIKTMLPSKAWNSLSADLYATFWGLTLYDLYVPRNRYESEIGKQHAALKALEELSDNSSSAIAKRKKDKERIQESLDRLTTELQKHEEHVESVRRRLAREKDTWLSSCLDTLKINMEFLQRCIFPRCTFSMPDAVYCAHFVNTLHSLGTPFFNTVNHIDVLICKTLQPMICCCTEYEVGRLGRFLFETLKTAYHWKSDESIYERECGNMPGFAVYYRYPNSQRVTYGQFIKVS